MNRQNKSNGGAIFAGLVFGAAAGVVAGLLLAPEKGSVTRDKLKKKAEDLAKDFDKKASDLSEKAQEFANNIEKQIKQKLEEDKNNGDESLES